MGVRVNKRRLTCEMARRGWTRKKLARAVGVRTSTVNAALCGRRIHPTSLHQIAIAVDKTAPVQAIRSTHRRIVLTFVEGELRNRVVCVLHIHGA